MRADEKIKAGGKQLERAHECNDDNLKRGMPLFVLFDLFFSFSKSSRANSADFSRELSAHRVFGKS